MIKLFGWERKMEHTISNKREEELRWVFRGKIIEMVIDNLKYTSFPLYVMLEPTPTI